MHAIREKTPWFHKLLFWKRKCEICGYAFGVKAEPSRTMYPWDGVGEDPNRPIDLCRQCAAAHHDFWDEMWAEATPSY